MKPIAEVVDRCLHLMKPNQWFSWEEWWENIVQNGEMPRNKTWEYHKFIQQRNDLKTKINNELEAMRLPERLICIGSNHIKGLCLINETGERNVADTTVDKRISKIVRSFEISHREMSELAKSQRLLPEDQKMLMRTSDVVELQQDNMIGVISRMKSLPAASKTRLLKHLGVKDEKS